MKFLISGFEPFLDLKSNPTELLMKALANNTSHLDSPLKNENFFLNESKNTNGENYEFKCVVLPVEFESSYLILKQEIEKYKPDVVLAFGVAVERQNIELERVAINYRSLKNPDNTGNKPLDSKISKSGLDGLFSNLKVDEIVEHLNLSLREILKYYPNPNIKVSNSAGTYVCNALMYKLMIDAKDFNYLAGFIHVPNKTTKDEINDLKLFVIELIKSIIKFHAPA
jgi:pyroglutamyl-peptidase